MKPLSVAIIGAGNMGGAVAIGLHRFAPEYSLTVTTAHASTLEKYAALGFRTSLDNVAAALSADVVILGVKPWLVQSVLGQLAVPFPNVWLLKPNDASINQTHSGELLQDTST